MTATLGAVSSVKRAAKGMVSAEEAQRAAVRELVRAARERGEEITGPDGLLKTITKTMLESALEEELTEHWAMRRASPPMGGATCVTGTGPRRC